MTKVEKIEKAINDGINEKSKLVASNFEVSGLVSLKGRHIYNNLGSLATNFLEIGSHLGCSFTSSISFNDNIKTATSIDSFASDWVEDRQCMPIFLENVKKHLLPKTEFKFIHSDAFNVNLSEIPSNIDYYIYDGSHDEQSQFNALFYYYPILADEFIFAVDDFDWDEVSSGTFRAIEKCGFDILYQRILKGNDHCNDSFWNGYGYFLLKKK